MYNQIKLVHYVYICDIIWFSVFLYFAFAVIDDLPQTVNHPTHVSSHTVSTNETQHDQASRILGIPDAAFVNHIVDALQNASTDHL